MLYILDNAVIYDSVNGILYYRDKKIVDTSNLTSTVNKILHYLVLHHGELVTRDTLFNEIWEKAGVASSSNTLNQYISLLRKILSGYLGDKDIIVTVPRTGYYLSKNISVSAYAQRHRRIPRISGALTAGFVILTVFAGSILYTNQPGKMTPRKIGELSGCPIYDLSGVKSDETDASNLSVANRIFKTNALSCNTSTVFYISTQESLHLNKQARVMFSKCTEWNDNRNTCQNIYYYSWMH